MENELFVLEKKVLSHLEKTLNKEEFQNNPLLEEYKAVYQQYKKLYSQFVKIISISDRQQKRLININNTLSETKQRYFNLSKKLSQYISYPVVESVFNGKQERDLISKKKKLTIFCSGISGFTELAEILEPEELARLLNIYLKEMSLTAMKYGATLDKFVGGEIFMFFGDPDSLGEKEDAEACLNMALEMKSREEEINQILGHEGLHSSIGIQIGIATGNCSVGNFGCDIFMDYTAIGKYVDQARALKESAVRGEILLAPKTYELVKDSFHCEKYMAFSLEEQGFSSAVYRIAGNSEKRQIIRTSGTGFSLKIDMESLSDDHRTQVINSLKTVLTSLEKNQQ